MFQRLTAIYQRLTTMFGGNNDDDEESASPDDDTESEPPAADPAELEATASEPEGPTPAELDVRISELEDDIDSTESAVRAVQSSQEEMTESIDEMNETVRQLTGVYDRLMAEENPFMNGRQPDANQDGNGQTGHNQAAEPAASGESVVGFDELDMDGDEPPEPSPPETKADPDAESREEHAETESPEAELDTLADPAETGSDDPAVESAESAAPGSGRDMPTAIADGERAPMLEDLPDGYAGEVLAMEWLGALMERSGPAGALRAVEHYEEIGWISPEVKRRLIDIIGGPSLDVFVDPMQPREPTGAEHQASHEYLTVLAELDEI